MSACHPNDRAAVVATTIIQILFTALPGFLYGDPLDGNLTVREKIAEILRHEFTEVARESRDEIRLVD